MKKIIPFLLLIITVASSKDVNILDQNLLANSLLWKISGKKLVNPSYLYGTMHLICSNDNIEKSKVEDAIKLTSRLYLEVDFLGLDEEQGIMELLSDGIKIKNIKDKAKKEKLMALVSEHLGMKGFLIENTNLFTIFTMLAYKAVDTCAIPTSVEEGLEAKFKHDRTKIAGLETMSEQMQFLRDSEIASLDNTIIALEEFDKMKEIYAELGKLYNAENISALYNLMLKPSDVYTQEYINKMMSILLVKRNKNWVKQIPEIASQAPTIFAVGAAHLPGENGVIKLLRKAGYSVEAILDK